MLIKNLFERDIFRPINGVVKADQLDDSSVWQELDEFVITRELDQHFRKFINWYLDAVDQGKNPDATGKMGIWISGFFGSGKSHFLKVISYLLRNKLHNHDGRTRQAVEFFESKVKDAMLFGDIKRAVAADTDVILFNIDSKADHGSGKGRDLILRVFLRVLNELQGYSGDHHQGEGRKLRRPVVDLHAEQVFLQDQCRDVLGPVAPLLVDRFEQVIRFDQDVT